MLKIYNSLAREKQEFVPIEPGQGAHVRLRHDGLRLLPPRARARHDRVRRGPALAAGARATRSPTCATSPTSTTRSSSARRRTRSRSRALTARFIQAMDEDAAALGVEKPDFEPRATEHVPGMLEMIGQLEARGLAYRAASGDVNYAVRKFPGYGKLSGKSLDELRAGERVEVDLAQAGSARFRAVEEGEGRRAVLGVAVGAGAAGLAHRVLGHVERAARAPLRHPRRRPGPAVSAPRERDRAVRGRARRTTFVNYWMHNGFVRVDNEKMSKSLGNFFTVREVLAQLRSGGRALLHRPRALSQPAQLLRPASRRREARPDAALHRAEGHRRRRAADGGLERTPCAALPRGDERRLQYVRKPSRCCSIWRTSSTGRATRASRDC